MSGSGELTELDDRRSDDDEDELAALAAFRADVVVATGQFKSPGYIREDYFPTYAEEQADDLYGREVVQTPYFDLDKFESDLREGFAEADLDGTAYCVDRGR